MTSPRKFLVLGGVLAVIGLGVWFVTHRPATVAVKPLPVANPSAPAVENDGLPPRTVAENFTRASTQAERLKWVRQATEVAAVMEEFFSTGSGATEVVETLGGMGPASAGEQIYERFGVTMTDGTKRLVCVVPTAAGARVDFKAYARHGSVPWAALLAGQAKEAGEMRVSIEKGDYYNFEFKHDVRWQNFIATSPDLESPVWLYLARTDPALKPLEQTSLMRPVRATVALRVLGDSHLQRQFEISDFHGAGWVMED